MYIDVVPNRSSLSAILLSESFREGKKVRTRTLAKISKLPPQVIADLRVLPRGGTANEESSEASGGPENPVVTSRLFWGHCANRAWIASCGRSFSRKGRLVWT